MKPNFALDLSHDGINLWHRSASGWSLVGSVALDDPDFTLRLADLRKTAAQLASSGFTTKLIVPNSQVLYTEVDAPGPDDIAREVQIRAALDGVTPYPVGELVFDWRANGRKAKVAVVARETLDEAEAFASDNKLNPVSFVARPGRGELSGEAFFGKTKAATQLLEPGERVEPDPKPVPRAGKSGAVVEETEAEPPVTEAEAAPEPQQPAAVEPAPEPAAEPKPEPTPAPISELGDPFAELDALAEELSSAFDKPAKTPAPETPAEPTTAPKSTSRKETPKVTPPPLAPFPLDPDEIPAERPKKAGKSIKRKPAAEPSAPASAPAKPAPTAPSAAQPAVTPQSPAQSVDAQPSVSPAKKPDTVPAGGMPPFVPPKAPAQKEPAQPDAPETPASAAPATPDASPKPAPSFASRRAGSDPQPAATPTKPATPAASAPSAQPKPRPGFSATPDLPAPGPLGGMPPPSRIHADMADALAKPLPTPDNPFRPAPEKPRVGARVGGMLGGLSSKIGTPAPSEQPEAPVETSPEADPTPKPQKRGLSLGRRKKDPEREAEEARRAREAEALTVFGARKSQDVGGKPKYLGLILTLVLLLLMAVILVWSSFFVQDGQVSLFNPGTDVATLEPDTAAPVTPDTVPAEQTDPGDVVSAEPAATPETDLPATASVMSQEQAMAYYEETGIWQRAPDVVADSEQSTLAGLIPTPLAAPVTRREVETLPAATEDGNYNIARAAPIPPPPPDTSFALDANGLIEPQPDGALSPAGVLVYAGTPELVPPQRPGSETPAEPTDTATAEPDAADAATPDTTVADDATPAAEAEAIPDDLTPAPDAIHPKPRPADLVTDSATDQPEESDADAALIANDAIDDAINAAIENPFVGATELAVANTNAPSHRPANFSTIVASAQTSASDGSVAIAAPPPAATVSAIPTSASVATQATTDNAINLRKINLIGIMGSANARQALVRLANGRYVRVKTGDRLDGGQVTSISANQLTYQKGNRAYKLDLLPLG